MTEPDSHRRDQMAIIQDASGSLLQIIHNILDLSKIETGQMPVMEEEFVLEDIVGSVCSMFGSQASGKSLSFSTNIAPRLPSTIRSDPGLLKQVLVNLMFVHQGFCKFGTP